MSDRSDKWTDLFFDELPYSEEMMRAKQKVRVALSEEESSFSFETIAEKYNTLDRLAALVGYTSEDAERWRKGGKILDLKGTKKSLRKGRFLSYLISFLFALSFFQFFWTICFAVSLDRTFYLTLVLTFVSLASAICFLRLRSKKNKEESNLKYDAESYCFLLEISDKYAKRLLNSIALFFAAVTLFELSELSFYVFGNSKIEELAENLFTNVFLVAVPLFLMIKNHLCVKMLQLRISRPIAARYRLHVLGITLFSALFWGVVALLGVLIHPRVCSFANLYSVAAIIFFAMIVLYNFTLREQVTHCNVVFNVRRIAVVTILIFLMSAFLVMSRETWYTQTYINSVSVVAHSPYSIVYNEENGVYTLTASSAEYKILHLTDIHLGGSLFSRRKDLLALQACYSLIAHTHPDLVIVTGDLCFPMGVMSLSFNNSAPVHQFAAFMRNVGIPWAFTYGNHDTESLATMKEEELTEVYKSLSYKTSATLLYPYVQPSVTGRNNQLIEIRNRDGSLNTALFLLDSNAYTGEGFNTYDYIHDDQVDWYESQVLRLQNEEGRQISSLAFFHIPLIQYRTAYELYLAGSEEVTYHFGENNEAFLHTFSCSSYDSSLFERMVALGSTTGTFCGHDHYNNASITYRGIRLTYGMSIDYLAMPGIEKHTSQRGAELITLKEDSSWEVCQIPLTSVT